MTEPAARAKLVYVNPDGESDALVLGPETWLGRAPRSTLALSHTTVSRRHALIRREAGGGYAIMDLGSSNGTFVNGERVTLPITLRDGDEVRLGSVKLVFSAPGARPPADAATSPIRFSSARSTLRGAEDASRRVMLIGTTPSMAEVFHLAKRAAESPIPVLIEGETGTGKELVARSIHESSVRARGPFVAINCSALPEGVLESELFGHRRGAFTGASEDRAGLFEAASHGTLFLDEVGEMPLSMQPKLLRFLQGGEVLRVGETRPRQLDVRVVSATNRDLDEEIESGRFRKDLFYRLSALSIRLPPLRDRREDVPLIIERLLAASASRHRRAIRGMTPQAVEVLQRYSWPGNVRELENEIHRAVALAQDGDLLDVEHLSPRLVSGGTDPSDVAEDTAVRAALPAKVNERSDSGAASRDPRLRDAMAAFERTHIASVLEESGGNVSEAARMLGVSRGALHRKLREHGLR